MAEADESRRPLGPRAVDDYESAILMVTDGFRSSELERPPRSLSEQHCR
jgi:hypothetical protein